MFPTHRLVVLSLGLLNALLLIAAVVIGIYCAKAKDLPISNSAATPLLVEVNYLSNHNDIIRAKLETQAALARERTFHQELKMQLKQTKTVTDGLQRRIETLQTERTNLKANKTSLEENCGRCLPGWILLKSSCYYFSPRVSDSKKNWPDSRADCISHGGDLLVINNLEEQQLLQENRPSSSSSSSSSNGLWWQNGYWIGLTDVGIPGAWVWVNNMTEVETMYWRTGQPDRSGLHSGHCAASYHFPDTLKTWYTGKCHDLQLNWICEKELVS